MKQTKTLNEIPVLRFCAAQGAKPSYKVSRERAEQMVASGRARWIPGLKRLQELKVKPRGQALVWRKVTGSRSILFGAGDGKMTIPFGPSTMQLVPGTDSRKIGKR